MFIPLSSHHDTVLLPKRKGGTNCLFYISIFSFLPKCSISLVQCLIINGYMQGLQKKSNPPNPKAVPKSQISEGIYYIIHPSIHLQRNYTHQNFIFLSHQSTSSQNIVICEQKLLSQVSLLNLQHFSS